MVPPDATAELPIRDGEQKVASEQEINPWDVQAAQDKDGNSLAFDYVAISQCVQLRISCPIL
jgi:tryptophanyl-tRNA synthetase